jgi:hypothetical protein
MNWRNSSVVVILILANYLVFSSLAAFVFPPEPLVVPTHVPQATFTRGAAELRNVGTLTYNFLTPTIAPTSTLTPTATITATGTIRTAVPTTAPKSVPATRPPATKGP